MSAEHNFKMAVPQQSRTPISYGVLWACGVACLSVVVPGCSEPRAPAGPTLSLRVAPLDLQGIDYACYDLQVIGPDGPVVSLGDPSTSYVEGDTGTICSWQYGNGDGGDIAYVAPCDADDGDTDSPAPATNTVTLWVDGLYVDADGDHDPDEDEDVGDWQDPCPSGCSLQATCRENADTPVVFDLTIMRNARQGFFDVAVDFEDVFCSAKVDTCYAAQGDSPARPITLLFDDTDGDPATPTERVHTAVMALACTPGEDASPDWTLALSDIVLDCGDTSFHLDPTDPGHQSATAGDLTVDYAVTLGDEQLDCGGGPGSCGKRYWTMGLSLPDLVASGAPCTLRAQALAVADSATLPGGVLALESFSYPAIDFTVPLTVATEDGVAAVCEQYPLGGGNGVGTVYVGDLDSGTVDPTPMCWYLDADASAGAFESAGASHASPETAEPLDGPLYLSFYDGPTDFEFTLGAGGSCLGGAATTHCIWAPYGPGFETKDLRASARTPAAPAGTTFTIHGQPIGSTTWEPYDSGYDYMGSNAFGAADLPELIGRLAPYQAIAVCATNDSLAAATTFRLAVGTGLPNPDGLGDATPPFAGSNEALIEGLDPVDAYSVIAPGAGFSLTCTPEIADPLLVWQVYDAGDPATLVASGDCDGAAHPVMTAAGAEYRLYVRFAAQPTSPPLLVFYDLVTAPL